LFPASVVGHKLRTMGAAMQLPASSTVIQGGVTTRATPADMK
jgi:hypothetical protein